MWCRTLRFTLFASIAIVVGFAPAARAEVYGFKSCGSDPVCNQPGDASLAPTTLFSLSNDGLVLNVIANVTVSGAGIDADALAVSIDQRLFGYELLDSSSGPPSGSRLIEVDRVTGVATPIGVELSGREMRGAVFDRSGRLRVYDYAASELLEIDAGTGAVMGTPTPLDSQWGAVSRPHNI